MTQNIYFDSLSFLPDELFSKKVSRRSLRAVNQMVIPKGPGPNSKVDIPYGTEDLLYGIF